MHALKELGVDAVLSRETNDIRQADCLVLPGVGAFGVAADRLRSFGLDEQISEFIETDRPFLGICVGMQLLMEVGHEFGTHKGLGLMPGVVERLSPENSFGDKLRVPVIGWNTIQPPRNDRWQNTFFEHVGPDASYYFVHSYAVRPQLESDVLAVARVGNSEVVAAINRDNMFGVQFHPERSDRAGLTLLQEFVSS